MTHCAWCSGVHAVADDVHRRNVNARMARALLSKTAIETEGVMRMQAQSKLEQCRVEAGRWDLLIDRSRCEAKNACVRVCPYNVFEVRKLTQPERQALSLLSRLRVFVHGGKQAFAVRADDCHACGLCVTACPEDAIRLVKRE